MSAITGYIQQVRNSRYWLAEVPALNVMTQGFSKQDVIEMIEDAVLEHLHFYHNGNLGGDFRLTITSPRNNLFGLSASDPSLLLALARRRNRFGE